jgi:UDP-2,3-diacylglucosamine pyrophosphatase LpxH
MSLDKEYTRRRLDTLWQRDDFPILDIKGNKYVLFSDLHMGDGGGADDFFPNEKTLEIALEYYRSNGFKLILVGDVEDLWKFGLEEVRSRYFLTAYKAINAIGDPNVYRIFGNHDGDWDTPRVDPIRVKPVQLGIAREAIKMRDVDGDVHILICHGHQGDIESDRGTWISRPAVRFYRLVEPILRKFGWVKQPPAIRSQVTESYEQIFYEWAKKNRVLIICGHSHRAIFASKSRLEECMEDLVKAKAALRQPGLSKEQVESIKEQIKMLTKEIREEKKGGRKIIPVAGKCVPGPNYFNTGCGIYNDGITAIELTEQQIRLVKWNRAGDPAGRYVIYKERDLISVLQQL